MMAQEASWDSRTMVEKPVRNSEFCISCTMPESEALTISMSIAPSLAVAVRRHHAALTVMRMFLNSSTRADLARAERRSWQSS